jgi:hypothetical protein
MSSTAASIALRLNWARQDLFGDLRVRHGIKLGLAGLLALFCSQALRLPSDNWAILTVMVLMNAQFAGAFVFKAAMRMTGTIAGALIGVWLVGDFTSTPAMFLPLFFLVMTLAGYKYGQVGARQVPYAYFLLGLTTLTIATDGVTDPGQAWQIGLDRTEEIFVGIISSLLITTVLWPRYAREEFLDAARDALKMVGQLILARAGTDIDSPNILSAVSSRTTAPSLLPLRRPTPIELEKIHQAFGQQLSILRNLLNAGSRESTFFSARLSNYNAFLVSLINLFQVGLDVRRHTLGPLFSGDLQYETESLLAAISEEFDILTGSHPPGEKLRSSQMNEAFAVLEEKVNKIRDQGVLVAQPLETLTAFAGHFAVLQSLRDELKNIRSAMEGLPRFGQPDSAKASSRLSTALSISEDSGRAVACRMRPDSAKASSRAPALVVQSRGPRARRSLRRRPLPEAKPHWDFLPTIDWFWVKVGIKGGLAAVISIVFLKWIHPPGPANVPTWAWLLVVMNRFFLRLGGTGDLRAFQTMFCGSLILAACAVLLILTTPFLANYAVMNLILFLVLFTAGFLTVRIPGINFWMEFAFLTISAIVALNPQELVPTQTVIDSFIGIMFGLLIATVVGRLLWPILPQRILRDSLLALFTDVKALLGGDPHQERIRTHLAILSLDALGALHQIRITGCSEEEKLKFTALIRALQVLVARSTQLVRRGSALRPMTIPINNEGGLASHRDIVPEITTQILRPQFERLEIEFKQMLDAFAECFRQGDCRRQLPTVRGALSEMDHAVQKLRERNLLNDLTLEAPLLDLVDRYHATADALDECSRLLCTLQIQRYWGDYGL